MKVSILLLCAFTEKRMTTLCFQAPGEVYEKQQEKKQPESVIASQQEFVHNESLRAFSSLSS